MALSTSFKILIDILHSQNHVKTMLNIITLGLLRALIGQFSVLYSIVRSAKIKAVFVAKMFRDLSPSVLNLYGSSDPHFFPSIYGPRCSRLGHKSMGEKLGP